MKHMDTYIKNKENKLNNWAFFRPSAYLVFWCCMLPLLAMFIQEAKFLLNSVITNIII